jgi:hypothetical protein
MVTDAIRAGSLNLALRNATNQDPQPTTTTTTVAPPTPGVYSAAPFIVSNAYTLSKTDGMRIDELRGYYAIYANNLWVATGTATNNISGGDSTGNIWTSINASNWVIHPCLLSDPSDTKLRPATLSVWYNNSLWVAGGLDASGYNIASSTDASEWTRHLVEGGDVGVSYVRNVNNLWVAFRPVTTDNMNLTNVYTSTNASDWTAYTISSEGNTPTFKDVAFFNGNYLLLGTYNTGELGVSASELIYAGTTFNSMNRVFSYETSNSQFLTLTSLSGQCVATPYIQSDYAGGIPVYAVTQNGTSWNTVFPRS